MIRTRSITLSLTSFLLLSAGAVSAGKTPQLGAPRPAPAVQSDPSTPDRSRVRARRAARIVPDRARSLSGVGQCPTGIELELWPPNHKYVDIDLAAVLGPNTQDIEIDSITQDEPVNDRGDGNTVCDGNGIGTSVAHIRSERSGLGNGRVYEIQYSAFQGACSGVIHVLVPHDQSGRPAEDDGQTFDSTEGCP